ncbi:hypothetical protein KC363_g5512 [Hortaea werneckii]|nr:hypothetical protein KC361_g2085 [Hortaea werneckii]KAI7188336.1 hypothetical protein KC363_g5512 [Hortaea werneckii]KAI7503216.1 hypothetical protein KC347_g8717 [Hortaea werneckii]
MEVQPASHAAAPDPSPNANDPPGPYVLRDLIRDVPLGTQDDGTVAHITCVDAWNGNLYIGTSAGEVLHYVSIPGENEDDDEDQPAYIFATKLEPPYTTQQEGADRGVKQLLVLPDAGKACVLCNGTVTFYTLPELSPAFEGKIKQPGCLWVGGIDHNEAAREGSGAQVKGTVVVICLKQRLRLIRIGEEARKIRDIELGGVSAVRRRDDLACVADAQGYSLLDVVNQRKIELFPISSSAQPEPTEAPPQQINPPRSRDQSARRSFSAATSPQRQSRAHERNFSAGAEHLRPDSSSPWPTRSSSRQEGPAETAAPSSPTPGSREGSPMKIPSADHSARTSGEAPREPAKPLPPNIVSPTPNEFLLTTGTKLTEPGVGMFVNLEGDVVRGTIEFSTYPESLVLDGSSQDESSSGNGDDAEGYVLALVNQETDGKNSKVIEAQRWDVDPSEVHASRSWLSINATSQDVADSSGVGLRLATTTFQLAANEIKHSLRQRRLNLDNERTQPSDSETRRDGEEDRFASRFAQVHASVLLYHGDRISWVVRNALILQLDHHLNQAIKRGTTASSTANLTIDVHVAQRVANSIRGQEPKTELDFLTLTYIRQKASLLLFGNLVLQTMQGFISYEHDKRRAEDALIAGEVDPRTILSLVPKLAGEVDEGTHGIWVPQGLTDVVTLLRQAIQAGGPSSSSGDNVDWEDPKGAYGDNLLQLVKRYLMSWRKKKGFGSVADETQVFRSVDAALLHVLLMLDTQPTTSRGPAAPGTLRAELNDVVDKGVECFDRAKELCEEYHRLYVLSRLYQSRKMVGDVLATWRRIIEGEEDRGGELVDGEQDVRRYLTKLRDHKLVQDYGAWLATRNPRLGVQVFADENARVKFQPQDAVAILKEKAPGAVKEYLEYLVFGKNHSIYVKDLIAFYLDAVLSQLRDSQEARDMLIQSYETYRALRPPKPTYRQFITDNAPTAEPAREWWNNRLRLLQLIGGSHGGGGAVTSERQEEAEEQYSRQLAERLREYSAELVPEMILLNGREGKHDEALKLLVHGLGDYDTAIRYCLLGGGTSLFHPGGGGGGGGSSGGSTLGDQQPPLSSSSPLPVDKDLQASLFRALLRESFQISDLSERLERTAELLERFAAWFDVAEVLALIPDGWSVELVSGFLVHALRRLVRERQESVVVKGLAGAQNLRSAAVWGEKMKEVRAVVVREGEAEGDGVVGTG